MAPAKLPPFETFLKLRPDFIPLEGLAFGASDSAHQVFFGVDGSNTVCVKPYQNSDNKEKTPEATAEHEKSMLEKVKKLGFYTLRPLRIITTNSGDISYLLTEYEPDLTTMSTVVQANDEDRRRGREFKLINTAKTLADLHCCGITHGDAQIKNFAISAKKPGIVVFDFENAGTEETSHKKHEPYLHDLESLVQSLAHKHFGGVNVEVANKEVVKLVLDPYESRFKGSKLEKEAERIAGVAMFTHHQKHEELHPQPVSRKQ